MTTDSPSTELALVPALRRQWIRRVISVLLLVHLLALITPPLAMQPAGPLWLSIWSGLRPYLEGMYLNHGYHFFAPDPGPSHLIRYELEFADGSQREGHFPDSQQHRPRLLYHRHFMLTEYVNRLGVDESQAENLQMLTQSYAAHLLNRHRAKTVRLYLQRRYIPSPEDVRQGISIHDARYLAERPLGEFAAAVQLSELEPFDVETQ